MPWDKDRDLRHHGVREAERRSEVLELFDGVSDEPGVLEASKALGARTNVRLEGGNTKTLLVIEEEVDLSWEQVTVIHGKVYAAIREWVSRNKTECLEKIRPLNGVRQRTSVTIFQWNFLPELITT
ncbi:MAG TPA: hypothetical protein VH080_10085 [Gemmatimonadaceae bacterium]|nr:hypothetical protein [Gemmatimonadaceae bacterium]